MFEHIFQNVPVSMYVIAEEKFLLVNTYLCELLDCKEEDLLTGKIILKDIIHTEDFPEVRKRVSALPGTGAEKARYRIKVNKSDGSFLHVEINSTLSEFDGKRVFIGSVSDITEEVLAQSRLKESEERYNSLFFENPDAIFTFDMGGQFIDINPGAVAISGYTHDELLKMSFIPLIAQEYLNLTLYYFQEALKGNSKLFEINLYDKNGELLNLEVTSFPMQKAGKIIGAYGIAKDITSRNEYKRLLEEMAFFDQLT